MKLSKKEKTKREEIVARSDKAIDKLNDHSKKYEKLLKFFGAWEEEDSLEKSEKQKD